LYTVTNTESYQIYLLNFKYLSLDVPGNTRPNTEAILYSLLTFITLKLNVTKFLKLLPCDGVLPGASAQMKAFYFVSYASRSSECANCKPLPCFHLTIVVYPRFQTNSELRSLRG